MGSKPRTLEVLYGQLAIFWVSLQQPFNDWLQKHVDQGFAWRPGSVSFRTLAESGRHIVEIEVLPQIGDVADSAIRAIEVPFEVPMDGEIELASISDSVPFSLPPGHYCLRCELFAQNEHGEWPVKFTLSQSGTPQFRVLRADKNLVLDGGFMTDARAATN